MIMRFYISKLKDVMSLVIRYKEQIAMTIAIAFLVSVIGYYIWMVWKFFLFALVLCVIGTIVSSGGPVNDVDADY